MIVTIIVVMRLTLWFIVTSVEPKTQEQDQPPLVSNRCPSPRSQSPGYHHHDPDHHVNAHPEMAASALDQLHKGGAVTILAQGGC